MENGTDSSGCGTSCFSHRLWCICGRADPCTKQIAIIDNETEFMENATETTIHYEEFSGENLDFADSKATDRTEELIQTSDFVGTVTEGTKDDLWSLKAEEKIDGKIEVGYVYPKLSDAFKDQNIGIDVSYIEANYPTLWSEKACQLCYDSRDADTFSRGAFFASYRKGDSQAVSIQYEVSDITNEDDYILKKLMTAPVLIPQQMV